MFLEKPIKKCLTCRKPYPKNDKYSKTQWVTSKYCSYKCHAAAKKEKAAKKPKAKKVCRFCSNIFYKDPKLSPAQWEKVRFCSNSCSAASKRKHKDSKAKDEAYRRRQGMSIWGSEEHLAKLTENTREAMYRPEVQEKIRAPRNALTLEHRMKISDIHAGKMPLNMQASGRFPNVQRGYYDINGTTIYFRSKWEANYALYLDFLVKNNQIKGWDFEPDTFMFEAIKLGTRSYTPDFRIIENNDEVIYHEVKGYMDSRSKTKLKRFAKYYPDETLILIDSDQYATIKKQVGKMLSFY